MTTTVTKPCGRRILYYCPATMTGNVEREFRHWNPKRSVAMLGGQSKIARRFLLDTMKTHPEYVVIINYEAGRKDNSLIDDLIDIEFDTIIIDEAHNVKDRKSKAYRDVFRICHPDGAHGGPNSIPFILPMSGTPILNRPQEFFSLLTLVDPYHFHSENYFLRDFCQQDIYTGKWRFKPGGVETLFKRFPNLFLRRTKEQAGIVLPPLTVTVHEIEVDELAYPLQADARNQMRQWGSIMLDPAEGKALSAAAQIAVYTRLRQIEVWPAGISVKDKFGDVVLTLADKYRESQKLDEIIRFDSDSGEWVGLIPEICRHKDTNPDGERTVLFSQFIPPLEELKDRCEQAGYNVAMMIGATPDDERNKIAMDMDNKFKDEPGWGKYDLILGHYKIGGEGVNYTAASQMIILDEQWNPGKRDQAYGRIERMGQDKPMTIHVLRDKLPNGGGIDIWLNNIIQEKENLVDGFNAVSDDLAAEALDALRNGLI